MEFNNIDEIISLFNLEGKETQQVKKELKRLLLKYHPDKTGKDGKFKNHGDETKFTKIKEALEFLNNKVTSATSITKTSDSINVITKAINELITQEKVEVATKKLEEKTSNLTSKLQESIITFNKQYKTPKISGAILTTVITAVWLFPKFIKGQPLFTFLARFHFTFAILWILSLIFLGVVFLMVRYTEFKDSEIKGSYKLESTQNLIFSVFIKWISEAKPGRWNYRDSKSYVKFTKDDLISFLTVRYTYYRPRFESMQRLEFKALKEFIKKVEDEMQNRDKRNKNNVFRFFISFFPVAGEIDSGIALVVSDLIIERLQSKGVIIKLSDKSLSDIYEYEEIREY